MKPPRNPALEAQVRAKIKQRLVQTLLEKTAAHLGVPALPAPVLLPPPVPAAEPGREPERATAGDEQTVAETLAETVEETVLYVYAVVPASAEVVLPTTSMDSAFPVTTLAFRDLQAIYSEVPRAIFAEASLRSRIEDQRWMEMTVQRHYETLGQIQTRQGVLPMRFCTICYPLEGLQRFLEEQHEVYATKLQELAGKQEWSVRLYANTEVLTRRVVAEESDLNSQDAVDALRRKEGQQLHQHLSAQAADSAFGSTALQRHAEPGEVLARNAAYLVALDHRDAFLRRVEALQQKSTALGWRVHLTGPWLPFHFIDDDEQPPSTSASTATEESVFQAA